MIYINIYVCIYHDFLLSKIRILGSFPVYLDNEENYGLIRPSLIKQLRSILDQYPDNGQILKVQRDDGCFLLNLHNDFKTTILAI